MYKFIGFAVSSVFDFKLKKRSRLIMVTNRWLVLMAKLKKIIFGRWIALFNWKSDVYSDAVNWLKTTRILESVESFRLKENRENSSEDCENTRMSGLMLVFKMNSFLELVLLNNSILLRFFWWHGILSTPIWGSCSHSRCSSLSSS